MMETTRNTKKSERGRPRQRKSNNCDDQKHADEGVRAPDAISRHLGSRVKQLRANRSWSLEALAAASGVSRSMLSQIEREQANPTLAVTLRIARAFGFTLGELLQLPDAASAVTVIRADDHAYHYRSDKDCRIRTLSPLNLEKDVEFYEVRLQAGGALRSSPHFEARANFLPSRRGDSALNRPGTPRS